MTNYAGNIRVLFIDDELFDFEGEDSKESYKIKELEKDGDIDVKAAVNGTEALQEIQGEAKFDIIVLDIMMAPGEELTQGDTKNGYETGFVFLKKIRKELHLNIPVIVLTNYPKPLTKSEKEELSVTEYLSKPMKMWKLAELIRLHVREENGK